MKTFDIKFSENSSELKKYNKLSNTRWVQVGEDKSKIWIRNMGDRNLLLVLDKEDGEHYGSFKMSKIVEE